MPFRPGSLAETTPPPFDVYFCDLGSDPGVFRVEAHSGIVTAIPNSRAAFGMAVDGLGNVYLAGVPGVDGILRVPSAGGASSTVAPELMTGTVAVDAGGSAYTVGNLATETSTFQAVKVSPDGSETVIWSETYPGDGGQLPWAIDVDGAANVYILLLNPVRVVRISAERGLVDVITLAGIVTAEQPSDFAVDASGQHVYFADPESQLVVKVALSTGTYEPVGSGLGGLWVTAAIDVDPAGNLYVAEKENRRVVMIEAASGIQRTICYAYEPGGVAVQAAQLHFPRAPGLVGRLLAAAAADGGGWIVIGNRFIPIPPRSPAIAEIARAAVPYLDRAIDNRQMGDQLRSLR
jgi:hypothetical protein